MNNLTHFCSKQFWVNRTYPRYPDALSGDLVLSKFYEIEDAEGCINLHSLILKKVKTFFKNKSFLPIIIEVLKTVVKL